ncbi:phosphoribosylformylglycinamidine synthase subunit PurS [Parasphingorhabdus sp. DH2-15]|jgi:phosphoribosylformylglycinamidine synthase|uniref:phosphoribosylformylglycinamidine synthase subunit PurS n=1 Tax=Parasphingorhabdus sp. DH2-15 TaxID=3444112 RepID=UPI003F687546
MKVRIYISLKHGVLDPQGKATHNALSNMGFDGVNDVRCGRVIDLDVSETLSDEEIGKMCEQLLANTVIEDYSIVRMENG